MADLAVGGEWLIAVVLMIAGCGKFISPGSQRNRLLAVAEIALAILLVLRISILSVALAAFFCTALFVHGLYQRKACRCFGESLPATSVDVHRVRNGILLLVAATVLITEFFSSSRIPNAPIGDLVVGSGAGLALLAGPWLFEWARHSEISA